jgi:hypothetical protein
MARADYPHGQAYINGEPQDFDLFFRVHVRRDVPRDELYQQAFDRFDLEYPPLAEVKKAVEAKNWDNAVTELVKHFESREDCIDAERATPQYDPNFDTDWADWSALQLVRLEDGYLVDIRPNWNHNALWPERGGVGLTRTGLRKPLSIAYEHTGNVKYAKAFNDLIQNFLIYCPSPVLAGAYPEEGEVPAALPSGIYGGSMWSALSIGARMVHGFHYYSSFVNSPYFTEDTRAAWIIDLARMGAVLERMKGAGNWQTQMSDALFKFGMKYPEYKRSENWFKQGFNSLVENALSTVRPDGVLQEPTMGYHRLVANRYTMAVKKARQMGLEIPAKMEDLTEKMLDYVLYSIRPDGLLPAWGDCFPPERPYLLERGAELFDRPDMLYMATNREKGHPPAETSKAYLHGGYFFMRTGWEPDANYMGIHCGPHGSHGHFDALHYVVSAFGRPVLIDPGVGTYGTPQARELKRTSSHNTITVDNRQADYAEHDVWTTTDNFDFLAGHNIGYRDNRDIQQYRRIYFLKSSPLNHAMWVILDDVIFTKEADDQDHEVQMNFRFYPLEIQPDPQKLQVRTAGDDANLLIDVLDGDDIQMSISQEIAAWEKLRKVPNARFTRKGKLPVTYDSLLVPFRGADAPDYKVRQLDAGDGNMQTRAVWIELGDRAALVLGNTLKSLTETPAAMTVNSPAGKVAMHGAAAVVQFNRDGGQWSPAHISGARLRTVEVAGEKVFAEQQLKEKVDQAL